MVGCVMGMSEDRELVVNVENGGQRDGYERGQRAGGIH
jgi:hypothetical protein